MGRLIFDPASHAGDKHESARAATSATGWPPLLANAASGKEPAMTTADTRGFLVELVGQLFHEDLLITEQAERIDAP